MKLKNAISHYTLVSSRANNSDAPRLKLRTNSCHSRLRRNTAGKWNTMGVFHLPRDSGNSGWVVNETRFFGLFHWKISGKSGTSEKVVPFSRWKFSDGTACSIYGFRKGLPVPGRSRPYLRQGNMAATPSATALWLPSPPLSTNTQSVMAS